MCREGWRFKTGKPCFPGNGHPDFGRHLSGKFVIVQGRKQTNHPSRDPLASVGVALPSSVRGTRDPIQPTADPLKQPDPAKTTRVDTGNPMGIQISWTEHTPLADKMQYLLADITLHVNIITNSRHLSIYVEGLKHPTLLLLLRQPPCSQLTYLSP